MQNVFGIVGLVGVSALFGTIAVGALRRPVWWARFTLAVRIGKIPSRSAAKAYSRSSEFNSIPIRWTVPLMFLLFSILFLYAAIRATIG